MNDIKVTNADFGDPTTVFRFKYPNAHDLFFAIYTCFQKHRDPDFSLSTRIAFESPIVRVSFTLLTAPQIGCTLIENVQMNIIAFRGSLYRMEDYLKGRSI